MNRILRVTFAAAVLVPLLLRAQNVVFNDSFTADSLNPSTYPAVTGTSTGWAVMSSKASSAPTESGGVLTINMASTTSGFIEAEALFSSSAVQLLPGTYIELQATFVPTSVLTAASDNLIVGLFNSGGSKPVGTLLNSGLTSGSSTAGTGGAKGWLGFNANIPISGSGTMRTRAAQTGTNNTVQDVLIDGQSSSTGYTTPAAATISSSGTIAATFVNGNTYTVDYKLSLSADGNTLTAACSVYNGTGVSGTGLNTRIGTYSGNITGANLLTKAFDAMAIGWRADAGAAGKIQLSALSVRTTGGTPWFTTLPPANMQVTLGDSLNLNAVVAGTGITSYRWQFSGDNGASYANIDTTTNPSAATTSLTLSNVQSTAAGLYRLTATNAAGTSNSAATSVTTSVNPVPPTISIDPVDNTVLAGTAQTFSVTANGSSPLAYQWQVSPDGVAAYVPISGATAASFTIASPTLADEGYYKVVVSNGVGSATSAVAHFVVNQPLTITTQPTGAALNVGDNYTLSVIASGKPAPTGYQWSRNGVAVSGATSSSYAITSATAASAGVYTVTVNNSSDQAISNPAAIAVLSPTFTATAATPASGSTGVAPDTRINVTFNGTVSVGVSGLVKIFDTTNPTTPVDTIDLIAGTSKMTSLRAGSTLSTQALPVQTKTIGGATNFNYYPISVSGNVATIYPRNGVLQYGHSYYVTVDPGVFLDSTGLSWPGVSSNTGYTFSVRPAGPISTATRIVVAADGSGDFCTVQGAIDWVPTTNTTLRTILIKKGTYFEQVYFTSKTLVTFLGEDRTQTIITYPNNNNFNNGGTTRRMVFCGDKNSFISILNLTIANSTPQNGSQAEALVLNGNAGSNPAIVSDVDLTSYQDTLLAQGQVYVTNSHLTGDVDFMWGSGAVYFENCQITQVRTGGFFTQIRNSTTHGFVYVNCRFNAPAGVTGAYFGRIDPTSGQFPNSEVVILDSTVGDSTNNALLNTTTGVSGANYQAGWWLLNNASSASAAPNVHNWANNLVNGLGAALTNPNSDAFTVMPTDPTTQANYRNVTWVLNSTLAGVLNSNPWTPALAPAFAAQPSAQAVNMGTGFTLTAQGFGIPAVSYQWYRNGVAISGATTGTYLVGAAAGTDAGSYSVTITNASGSVSSAPTSVVVHGAPPVIMLQPAATSALGGTTATLSVYAVGDSPITYLWSKDGTPISGATNSALRLTGLTAANAGNYSVAVTNGGGSTVSSTAALTIATPANTLPTVPVIRNARFDVTAYGAVGDGATNNASAIQAAINAAVAAGGGTVEIPGAPAAYLSGPLTLASNIDLQIDGGATLKALPYGTYPNSFSSPAHFITIPSAASNVELSGNGTIDGDGNAWWAAFNANSNQGRPRMVQITKASNVLMTGLTFLNSPNFHLAFSGANNNVTIYGVTISAPGDSPNTDGMDIAGTNFLIQNCNVADGDDLIVAKPGSVFCQNLYIANCTFGTGHGVSIGGQTNVGLNGMTVTNCTFNGTDTGLRMKADPTQGGPVRNVTFSNITMTNVTYPIVFYSYYNQLGSPGAVSGSSQTTSTKVKSWNSSPPNSLATTTIPTWQNITVSNLTATGASGYSILWGLPLANALVANVTLDNVSISGGAGFEIYDATNVQFTGTTSVGAFVTCNSLAITRQPQSQTVTVGDSVTFTTTVVGASGQNSTAPALQWNLNGTPLTDGLQSDGSTIGGSTTSTLTISNVRATKAGNYTITASNALDGYDVGTNALVAGSLPVSATSAAGVLTVTPLPATLFVSGLTQTYDGTTKTPTVTTSPSGLSTQVAYTGGTTPRNAGSYPFTVTVTDPNYVATPVTGTLTVPKAVATITLGGLTAAYDGAAHGVTAATSPAGLNVVITYNGATTLPTDVGTYAVTATINEPNYQGSATGTFAIGRAFAGLTLNGLSRTYDGTPQVVTVTTSPAGLSTTTVQYNGSPTAPTSAGSYAVSVAVLDPNYQGAANATLVIAKANQTLTVPALGTLSLGLPVTVTATSSSGLPVTLSIVAGSGSLSGTTLTPTAAGTMTLRATQAGNSNYNAATLDVFVDVTNKLSQSITFAGIAAHKSTDAAFPLSATASSGLPVTFSVVSGPAMVNGSTLTLTGTGGTVVVRASQGGNATYSAAPSVDQSFQVTLAGTDTFFGDLVPDGTANESIGGFRILAASTKAGDIAAAIVADTLQGNVILVAPSLNLNVSVPITINADGTYSATFTSGTQSLTMTGTLANGILTGRIAALHVSFSTLAQVRTGTTVVYAGYYAATALNAAQGTTYSIVGPNGQALVLAVTPSLTTGGVTTVSSAGAYSLTPASGVTISGTIDASAAAATTAVVVNGQTTNFSGLKNQVVRTDRLVNLSSRGRVSGSSSVVVTGFVIGGSGAKQVLIRAIGPGLAAYGVTSVLPTPRLRLYQNGQVIAENSGWSTAANAADIAAAMSRVGAFPLTTGSGDSAILMTLQPGTYSAQVSGSNQAGVVMAEIYDSSINAQGEYQRLVNISTLGDVGTGENVLIGGFVVTGNSPKKVLIRGIGPTLAQYGVGGALADPKLTLYRNGEVLAQNDNWGTGEASVAADIAAANARTGAFTLPAGSKDAVLILTLAPGGYTAQVSGVNSTTGAAMVEMYEVPEN